MKPRDERLDVPRSVFTKELATINARRETVGLPPTPPDPEGDGAATGRPRVDLGLVGLALSGGGIRSSTFGLGVVQALVGAGVFRHVDYVSTVSGGGYTGSLLSSVLNGTPEESSAGAEEDGPGEPDAASTFPLAKPAGTAEPPGLRHLRNGSRYLSPGGFMDSLRLPAVFLRGLVLNGLLVLPWLMLAVVLTEIVHEQWWRVDWSSFGLLHVLTGFRSNEALALASLAALVGVVYFVFSPGGKTSRWRIKNRRDLWFTCGLVSVIAVLVLWQLACLVDLAIDIPLRGEDGLLAFLEENLTTGVGLAIGGGAIGAVTVLFAASRLSAAISRLLLYAAALVGPLLILGAFLLLCVAQLDSPFIRWQAFEAQSLAIGGGSNEVNLSNEFSEALRRRGIIYPAPAAGVEGWFVRGGGEPGQQDTWFLKKPKAEIERLEEQNPPGTLAEVADAEAAIKLTDAELEHGPYYKFVAEGDQVRIHGARNARPIPRADFTLGGVSERFEDHPLDAGLLKALRSRKIYYSQPIEAGHVPRRGERPGCWYLEKAEVVRWKRLEGLFNAAGSADTAETAGRQLAIAIGREREWHDLSGPQLAAAVREARREFEPPCVTGPAIEQLQTIDDDDIEQKTRFYRLKRHGSRVEIIGAKLRWGGAPSNNVLVSDQVFIVLLVLLLLLNLCFLDVNRSSLHSFYRDRLSRLYLFRLVRGERGPEVRDRENNDRLKLTELNAAGSTAPYHLLNATLNLQGSDDAAVRGRRAGFFIFSKHYCGGPLTGYCETALLEQADRHVNLGTAMAISAAAAAPNMGTTTMPSLVFAMTMLNLRLGYWLPNPRHVRERSWRLRLPPGSLYLVREARGDLTADRPFVNVSDGGHLENLGVYELLRRRCSLIIAVDGEADEAMQFHGLITLIRLARIDLGIEIDIALDELERKDGVSSAHWAIGTIRHGAGEIGHLVYVKSSVTGDEDPFVLKYRADNPTFPHESTADQYLDELQFEAYRALGEHVGRGLVKDPATEGLPGFADARGA